MSIKDNIIDVVAKIDKICKGAYSVVLMIQNYGLVGFRDKHGIRPLIYGSLDGSHMIASESICLQTLDYENVTNIKNGEVIIINENGLHKHRYNKTALYTPCIFEYIYISRAESVIDDVSVYQARVKMGKYLAYNIQKQLQDKLKDIDYVVPIPDTSRPSAIVVSKILNIPYYEIVIKNRYVSRTFIMDNQNNRIRSVKRKLGIVDKLAKNKNILLIDDSIVRGNTIKHVINTLRKHGINKIYVASCSPPVRYANKYGIDIPNENDLIANKLSVTEIEKYIGVDKLIYQTIDDLKQSIWDLNPNIKHFDLSVFDGKYIN